MAGEMKLAIILTATMRGAQAFNQANKGMAGMKTGLGHLTAAIKMFAVYAAFSFLKDAIKTFIEFEQTMTEAISILGGGKDEIKKFGDEVIAMSRVIPKTPNDLGLALYDIFSAGITDSADAMDTLELSAKAAVAGLTDTATAAKAGISTMNAFGMEADSLSHIFDVQFLTIKFGILRYEELANVVGQMAPAAKQAGQSMESMFATLSLLTKKGLDARKAAVALARAYEGITKPAAIEGARELGVSFVEMTAEAQKAWDELNRNKMMSDELAASYNDTELAIKDLGKAMGEVSLEQQKNRLEIMKIQQAADDQDRDMTEGELSRIDELEEANDRLSIQYQELSITQTEARMKADTMNESLVEQKVSTDEARKAFEDEIAISGKFRPLVDIVKDLGDKMSGLDEVAKAQIISKLFPQVRARRAILSIMGSEEELIKVTKEMEEQAGAMGDAYEINADTTANAMKLTENAMAEVKMEMAAAFLPILQEFMVLIKEDIVPILQNSFIPLLKGLIPVFMPILDVVGKILGFFVDYPGVLQAIIIGLIAMKVATVALNIAMAMNPVGMIIIAIGLLIAGIYLLIKNWDKVSAAFQPVVDFIVAGIDKIRNLLQPLIDFLSGAIIIAVGLLSVVMSFLMDKIEGVKAAIQPFVDLFIFGMEEIRKAFQPLFDTISFLIGQWDNVKSSFQPIVDLFVTGIGKIKDAFQPLIDMITILWDMIKGVSEAVQGVGKAGGGISGAVGEIGGLFGFAEGGVVTRPMAAMVGEAGPEAIIPLRGGSVPVEFIGGGGGGAQVSTNDTYNVSINVQSLTDPADIESGVNEFLSEIKRKKKLGE